MWRSMLRRQLRILEEVPSFRDVGYPIAEIEADGSFTITKHPGTGGLISEAQ